MPNRRRAVAPFAVVLFRCVLAAALGAPQIASAQALPKAGSTQPPAPLQAPAAAPADPAPPPARAGIMRPGGPSFVLRRVRFVGATLLTQAELQSIAAPQLDKPTTLADLEAIAQRVTERYRAAGYLLAQAIVPAQEVTSGEVEISVLEGRIGQIKVEVDPQAPIDEARVRAIVAPLQAGVALQQAELARVMLLLSDLPGLRAEASLEASEAAGNTDLAIGVTPSRRTEFAVDADNHGSASTSEYRIGLQGRWSSPTRAGDNLDYRVQLGSGGGLNFARIGYERPLNADGLRVGVSASMLEYALSGDFAALDASGRAKVLEVSLAHPLVRSRTSNLFAKLAVQRKLLVDRFGAVGVSRDKQSSNVSVGLSHENSDQWLGGGYTNAGITVLLGELTLDADGRAGDVRGTEGTFMHVNYNLSRLNTLGANMLLFIGLAGQWADRNLDSVEKASLGGPRGVRAYAPSEATADEAHILNAELRYSATPEVSLQGFYDWGWAKLNHVPDPAIDTENSVHLRGWGVGVFWGTKQGFALRASLAWRDTRAGQTDRRNPRLYFQLSKSL